jgi:hypothetical protein
LAGVAIEDSNELTGSDDDGLIRPLWTQGEALWRERRGTPAAGTSPGAGHFERATVEA